MCRKADPSINLNVRFKETSVRTASNNYSRNFPLDYFTDIKTFRLAQSLRTNRETLN